MKLEKTNNLPVDLLRHKFAGCRLTTSALFPDFSLGELFAEITACRVVKENERRQVYYLETPQTGYFLKFSTLVRRKDRWRHFLLPYRKWSEWNNLHRLLKAGVAAAKPVLKGEDKKSHPHRFFLLTEQVAGSPLRIDTDDDARKLGEYMAWLHSKGVYHSDLHPNNIIVTSEGQHRLIDVQQVFFLPWLPFRLRVHNLGKICFNISRLKDRANLPAKLSEGYNLTSKTPLGLAELKQAAGRHQQLKYRSRSKRCCRNSSEFMVVKKDGLTGYKKKSFHWGLTDLRQALEKGQPLKDSHVIAYRNVCIKKLPRRRFHRNRCLTSWKMSRALEVRGVSVPRALGYFVVDNNSCFLSEFMLESLHLNDYLSSLSNPREKRRVLKKLALWLRKIHDNNLWQRDFKSNNILCRNEEFFMIDLDDVKVRRLSKQQEIINLAQLNASVSNAVTLKDRLRFYHHYMAGQQPTRTQRRDVYRQVWDISKSRDTSIYDLDLEKLLRKYQRTKTRKSN